MEPAEDLTLHHRWIEGVSTGKFSASSVISECPPDEGVSWLPIDPVKKYSLIFVIDRTYKRVLLGLKKRGLGKDLWNGFGGKPEGTETMAECAARELEEESGLSKAALTFKGQFVIADSAAFLREGSATSLVIHIFVCTSWTGEPIETEEMKPRWFRLPSLDPDEEKNDLDHIPFDRIWPEQRLFLSKLLLLQRDEYMYGRVDYHTEMHLPQSQSAHENDLVVHTNHGKHSLRSWRFVRTNERWQN